MGTAPPSLGRSLVGLSNMDNVLGGWNGLSQAEWTAIFIVRMTELRGVLAEHDAIVALGHAAFRSLGSTAPQTAAERQYRDPL